jgi:hypothetical protein
MRAMVVREYGTAPVLCEVADPAGPAADVLAASLNAADMAVAAGLNPFRRPELPLVLGLDGVARRADGALVHFFWPAVPYGAFAERGAAGRRGDRAAARPAGREPSRRARYLRGGRLDRARGNRTSEAMTSSWTPCGAR